MSSAVSYPSCVRRSRRRWAVAVCLPVFCVLQVNVTREARCEESRHQCPQQLADFDESQLELAFVKGIEFLISTQRYDGGWGGPQWTGGVDSDPDAVNGLDIRPTSQQLYGDAMVWYNMFIIFVMYCMLPVPVKWCTVCCLLTAIIHIIVLAFIVKRSSNPQPVAVWNVFSIGFLYLGK